MCCHTEAGVADPTCYLTQSRYTDTRPTSCSSYPIIIIIIVIIIIIITITTTKTTTIIMIMIITMMMMIIIMMMMIIIIITVIINLIYVAQLDTNGILAALYIVIKYIQMRYMH